MNEPNPQWQYQWVDTDVKLFTAGTEGWEAVAVSTTSHSSADGSLTRYETQILMKRKKGRGVEVLG